MRGLLILVAWSGMVMTTQAATYVYVSKSPEQQIQVYRLAPATGDLEVVQSLSVDGSPGSLNSDPKRQFLFASLRSTSRLASFRIDSATGRLIPQSTADLPQSENAAFVTTDRSGRWLLSASYNAGTVVVHRIDDAGNILGPANQSVTTEKTAHSVAVDPLNKLVFVPHVTPNAIFQFDWSVDTGTLTLRSKVAGGTETAGPRHLAIHPRGRLAFTSNEQGSSISAYRLGADGLELQQTVSTLPDGYTEKNTTAEVKVHPGGRYVWVSNRGHDSLAGFAIDETTGLLSPLGQTATEKTPRSFEIDPSGRFAFAAGEGSGRLAVYRIDAANGRLERNRMLDTGKSLTWVVALDLDSK